MSPKTNELLRLTSNVLSEALLKNHVSDQSTCDELIQYAVNNFDEKDREFKIDQPALWDIFTSELFFLDSLIPIEIEYAPEATAICMVVTHLQKHGVSLENSSGYQRFIQKFGKELDRLYQLIMVVDDIVDEVYI